MSFNNKGGFNYVGSTGFTPQSVSGLTIWVNSQNVTSSSGNVSALTDLSGNSHGYSQATGANQPTLVSTVQNGYSSVRFAGNSGSSIMFTANVTFNQPFTVIMAMTLITGNLNSYILCGRGENEGVIYQNPGSGYVRQYSGVNGPSNTIAIGSPVVMSAVFNGASSAIYVNGTASSTATVGTLGTTGFALGGYYPIQAGFFSNFDLFEQCVYTQALSSTDRNSVESYVRTKYGF